MSGFLRHVYQRENVRMDAVLRGRTWCGFIIRGGRASQFDNIKRAIAELLSGYDRS
jgi:hypothetical protein